MNNDEDILRAVTGALVQSEEWRNVRLLLGRLDTEEAHAAIDTLNLLDDHFERICQDKPTWK